MIYILVFLGLYLLWFRYDFEQAARSLKYLFKIGIAVSVLINVITGGESNQTFSARNWQWKKDGVFNLVWLIDGTFNMIEYLVNNYSKYLTGKQPNINLAMHCMSSWIYWKTRKELNTYKDSVKQV
jgi:hypothetical protein